LEIRPPAPLPAGVAHGATPGDALGGYVVAAMAVMLVADALAPVTLRSHGAYANLVDLAELATARDEPTAAAPVDLEDVVGVKLVESEPAKMVGGNRFRL